MKPNLFTHQFHDVANQNESDYFSQFDCFFFITGVGKGLGGELSQISHFSDEEMGSRELEWSVQANTAAWNKIEASQLDDF